MKSMTITLSLALAFVLALGYIRRAVARGIETTSLPFLWVPELPGRLAQQARYLLLGLPVMVLLARLLASSCRASLLSPRA